MSSIVEASKIGDFERVKELIENGDKNEVKKEDIENAIDAAYEGTKIDSSFVECSEILRYLVANYLFSKK